MLTSWKAEVHPQWMISVLLFRTPTCSNRSFPWSMLPWLVQVLLVRHAAPPAAALEEAAVLAEDLD